MRFLILFFLYLNLFADNSALYFTGNCIACHEINKAVSAPSIIEIKEHYLSAFPKKKDFVEYMAKWVNRPNEAGSLMHKAIKKYDIMPYLSFDYETLKIISEYIYKTDFSKTHPQP